MNMVSIVASGSHIHRLNIFGHFNVPLGMTSKYSSFASVLIIIVMQFGIIVVLLFV